MRATFVLPLAVVVVWGGHLRAAAAGQTAQPPLQLGALHEEARAADPRVRQLELEAARTDLRLRNISAERLPVVTAQGLAQYQSDVPTPPPFIPGGQPLFVPPNQTYDAYLRVDQPLFEPSVEPRLAVERAQLAEAQARVQTALFGLRQEVNDAFFAASLLQERLETVRITISALRTLLQDAEARVRERTALPSEAASIEARLLQRQQDEAELNAGRRAALARLSTLIRRQLPEDQALVVPDLDAAVAPARQNLPALRARPEYEQFSRTRERLEQQRSAADARERPRVSAFGRLGYGKPGLNFILDEFDSYWLAGLQVQWTPWTWGTADRERAALAVQQQIVAADEEAFTAGLERVVQTDLADLDRLDGTLAMDDRIVSLRESVDRETRLRFDERVATVAEYLDRSNELLEARLNRVRHRVERAEARARFLTSVGLEVR
jgi:outer membrane protein TolC